MRAPASSETWSAVSTSGNIVATRPSTASSGTISGARTVNRSWWGWNAKTVEPSSIPGTRERSTSPTQL